MEIREARPGESAEIASILEAAYLQIEIASLRERICAGTVLVAVATGNGTTESDLTGPILGALVLDGKKITAIAVRPGRRGQGIGSALVAEAKTRRERLVAEFDPAVRPFWESVGFAVSQQPGSKRLRGVTR